MTQRTVIRIDVGCSRVDVVGLVPFVVLWVIMLVFSKHHAAIVLARKFAIRNMGSDGVSWLLRWFVEVVSRMPHTRWLVG